MRWLLFSSLIALVPLGFSSSAVANDEPAHGAAPAEAHAGAGHGAAASAEPNILELKPALAICTALVFLALFGILWKFAWGPLSAALDKREAYHQETLDKAENARAESERMLAEHRALMAKASDDVRAIMDEARRDAESMSNGMIQKAQAEALASKERAERDIAGARDHALAEIWTRTADLAVNVAGRVLAREIGPEEQKRLLDRAVSQLPAAETNGSKVRS